MTTTVVEQSWAKKGQSNIRPLVNIKYVYNIISSCRDLYSSGIVDYCLIWVLPLIHIADSIKVGIY